MSDRSPDTRITRRARFLVAVLGMDSQTTLIPPPDSELAPSASSRLLTQSEDLTATKKRVPFLIRLIGFGLIVAAADLVVTNTRMSVGGDSKHRIAARALASNSGENKTGPI